MEEMVGLGLKHVLAITWVQRRCAHVIEINPHGSDRCPHAAFQRIWMFMHPSVLSARDQMVA